MTYLFHFGGFFCWTSQTSSAFTAAFSIGLPVIRFEISVCSLDWVNQFLSSVSASGQSVAGAPYKEPANVSGPGRAPGGQSKPRPRGGSSLKAT